jgi:hypothetical protein
METYGSAEVGSMRSRAQRSISVYFEVGLTELYTRKEQAYL